MTFQEALAVASRTLRAAGVQDPARDARLLIAHGAGIDLGRVTLHLQESLTDAQEARFFELVKTRAKRVPMSHILGYRDFYGRRFIVSADVLDPRGDTETLVGSALGCGFDTVLDMGTGSGCLLVTLLAERAHATGVGSDISERALALAGQNANDLNVASRCTFTKSDWFADISGTFDLIVSNPPYIAAAEMADLAPELVCEPRIALTDESDGLSAYRIITAQAGIHLRADGWLMVEIGARQGPAVLALFTTAGFGAVALRHDLDGLPRVVIGQKPQ